VGLSLVFKMRWISRRNGLDLGLHGAVHARRTATHRSFDIGASAANAAAITTHPNRESMSIPNSTSPRPTLKLKVAPRATPGKSPSTPQSTAPAKQKPGAHWSDEYKERMQADMDALLR
jgi:hypothetical protein